MSSSEFDAPSSEGARPVAITGMHRSGTSMVARTLQAAGLYLGEDSDMLEPAPDNPEGFYEHEGFVRFGDDLLAAAGGAWDLPPAEPLAGADDGRVTGLRARALELIGKLSSAPRWGWKDPRTCLTARYWLDLLPELRFVVCVRHPLEVALSLKRRNNLSYASSLRLWQQYYEQLLAVVSRERRTVVHYESFFEAPEEELRRLFGFCDLAQDATPAELESLDPTLRHHEVELTLGDVGVPPETLRLYDRLRTEAGLSPEPEVAVTRPNLDRAALDLVLAREQLDGRARQIESLERKLAEAELEREELATRAAGLQILADLAPRLDSLEDAVWRLERLVRAPDPIAERAEVVACWELVARHVPRSASVLVIGKGDPAFLDLYGRKVGNFPQDAQGQYPGFTFANGTAAIAHLEAMRMRGYKYLLVPESAAWWLDEYPVFAEHLLNGYHVVVRKPALLVDITTRQAQGDAWPTTLSALYDQLVASTGRPLALLDWTDRALTRFLSGRNVFGHPVDTNSLPYLDRTVDVVVFDDEERVHEARRVAAVAVVRLEPGDAEPRVGAVDLVAPDEFSSPVPRVRLAVGGACDEFWLELVREAVSDAPDVDVVAAPDARAVVAAAADAEIVGIFENGVQPLPGVIRAARATFAGDDRIGAVACKLFAADGSLESAAEMCFSDGTWAGIAAGGLKVAAPWHEYARDVCSGSGVLFVRSTAIDKVDVTGDDEASPPLAWWAGAVWAAGLRVRYQPDAMAVRALGRRPEGIDESVARLWAPAVSTRPTRPRALDDDAWRSLVARDHVEGDWL